MANYIGYCKTNVFRVTDEERYAKLISGLVSEADIYFRDESRDGKIYHSFCAYDTPYWDDPDSELESGFCMFCEALQKILPEDEAFIYMEIGNEKLRCLVGAVIVVTKNEVRQTDIFEQGTLLARDMLGNPNFELED